MILRITPNFSGIMVEESGLESLDSYDEMFDLLLNNLRQNNNRKQKTRKSLPRQ
jgi:hypothetical protein